MADADVTVHGVDYRSLLVLLQRTIPLGSLKMQVHFNPASEEPVVNLCTSGHLHLTLGMGMPINAAFVYVLATYCFCYASIGKSSVPNLREGMHALEAFTQGIEKREGNLATYSRSYNEKPDSFIHCYRDILSMLHGEGHAPPPIFQQVIVHQPSAKKEDLN